MQERITYGRETKLNLAKAIVDDNLPVSILHDEYGINPGTMTNWAKKYMLAKENGTLDTLFVKGRGRKSITVKDLDKDQKSAFEALSKRLEKSLAQ